MSATRAASSQPTLGLRCSGTDWMRPVLPSAYWRFQVLVTSRSHPFAPRAGAAHQQGRWRRGERQSRAPGRVTLGPRRRRRHFGPPRPRPSEGREQVPARIFSCSEGLGTASPISSERPGGGGACRALGASRAGVTSPRTPLRPGGGWHQTWHCLPAWNIPGANGSEDEDRGSERLEPRGQRGHRTHPEGAGHGTASHEGRWPGAV